MIARRDRELVDDLLTVRSLNVSTSTLVFLHILLMILVHFLKLVMFTFRFVLIISSQCHSQVTVYIFYVWLSNVVDICAISFVSSATAVRHSVRA